MVEDPWGFAEAAEALMFRCPACDRLRMKGGAHECVRTEREEGE